MRESLLQRVDDVLLLQQHQVRCRQKGQNSLRARPVRKNKTARLGNRASCALQGKSRKRRDEKICSFRAFVQFSRTAAIFEAGEKARIFEKRFLGGVEEEERLVVSFATWLLEKGFENLADSLFVRHFSGRQELTR